MYTSPKTLNVLRSLVLFLMIGLAFTVIGTGLRGAVPAFGLLGLAALNGLLTVALKRARQR